MSNIDERIKSILSEEQIPPMSYDFAIKRTVNKLKSKKKSRSNIIIINCLTTVYFSAFVITGIVFSKDIENYIKKLFNNSNEAIDIAVENGYVQQEEMDYTYDKDIGIKVSSLFLDDVNLDIAFDFKIQKENVKSVSLKDITITNDNNKVIYRSEIEYAETLDEVPIYNSFSGMNEAVKLTDITFTNSILLGLRVHEEFNKLFFKVTNLDLTYEDNTKETIEGNWNFEITINDKMKESPNVIYTFAESNEYVESCTGTLFPSGMIVDLKLTVPFDAVQYVQNNIGQLDDIAFFYLKYNDEKLIPSQIELGNVSNTNYILRYDIGIFSNNINEFELYIEAFDATITLTRENN